MTRQRVVKTSHGHTIIPKKDMTTWYVILHALSAMCTDLELMTHAGLRKIRLIRHFNYVCFITHNKQFATRLRDRFHHKVIRDRKVTARVTEDRPYILKHHSSRLLEVDADAVDFRIVQNHSPATTTSPPVDTRRIQIISPPNPSPPSSIVTEDPTPTHYIGDDLFEVYAPDEIIS